MKIKKISLATILTISLLNFSGCNKKEESITDEVAVKQDIQNIKKNTLPTFHLNTINQKTITIEVTQNGWKFKEFPNKSILLVFFATWCPPCKAEIPHLINLQKKFSKDLQIIAISVDNNIDMKFLKDFATRFGINYKVTFGEENFKVANAVGGVSSIPAIFLLTKKGTLFQKYVGAVYEEILESDIKQVIKK